MNELFIVTFRRDFRYLRFCLDSISKFATGFDGVTIALPDKDKSEFEAQQFKCALPVRVKYGDEWPDNPMLWHEWVIMCADQWCPKADLIYHIDSDCIFTNPVTPEFYLVDGRPILRWEKFETIGARMPPIWNWKIGTEKCVPDSWALVETMRCQPLVYHRSTYALARKMIEAKTRQPADVYIRSCKGTYPQGFCEFVTLGNVALNLEPKKYESVGLITDAIVPPNHVIQFWSRNAPDLWQDIWMGGKQHRVIPINIISKVLGLGEPKSSGLRAVSDDLKTLKHREELGAWLNEHDMKGAGAEIGVMHAGYSESVLKHWQGKKYYMVDLWGRQDAAVYREKTDDIDYEAKYRDSMAVAERFPIVTVIRDYSVRAAQQVEDGSLDWVFIDANHSYRSVLEDMDAWFPKLRPGGVFAGHDYGHDTNYPHWCEVKPAVDRWMAEHNIAFRVTECSSWWAIKPTEDRSQELRALHLAKMADEERQRNAPVMGQSILK